MLKIIKRNPVKSVGLLVLIILIILFLFFVLPKIHNKNDPENDLTVNNLYKIEING